MLIKVLKLVAGGAALLLLNPASLAYLQTIKLLIAGCLFYLAFYEFQRKNVPAGAMCLALVWLFQPFTRHAIRRDTWEHIDLIVGCALIGWAVFSRSDKSAASGAFAAWVYVMGKVIFNLQLALLHLWACASVSWNHGFIAAVVAFCTPPLGMIYIAWREYSTFGMSAYVWTVVATFATFAITAGAAVSLIASDANEPALESAP